MLNADTSDTGVNNDTSNTGVNDDTSDTGVHNNSALTITLSMFYHNSDY